MEIFLVNGFHRMSFSLICVRVYLFLCAHACGYMYVCVFTGQRCGCQLSSLALQFARHRSSKHSWLKEDRKARPLQGHLCSNLPSQSQECRYGHMGGGEFTLIRVNREKDLEVPGVPTSGLGKRVKSKSSVWHRYFGDKDRIHVFCTISYPG